jgi:hypothetical protein
MPTPHLLALNSAELLFAPCYDPAIGQDIPWQSSGLWRCSRTWDSQTLTWEFAPTGGRLGTVTLDLDLSLSGYDRLITALHLPMAMHLIVKVRIDTVWHDLAPVTGTGVRQEVHWPLPTGAHLQSLKVQGVAGGDGSGMCRFIWWGVADSVVADRLAHPHKLPDPQWLGMRQAEPDGSTPRLGLLFDAVGLERLRQRSREPAWAEIFARLETRARTYAAVAPEADWDGSFPPWRDARYRRGHQSNTTSWHGSMLVCALVGMIREDHTLIDAALRRLFCLLHTEHWSESEETRATGSTWSPRCFLAELIGTAVALTYDWLGAYLSERARDLLRVALHERCLSKCQSDLWKWEYVHHMNQGPWFCRGLIFSGLVLEKEWGARFHVVDDAKRQLLEGMNRYLLPDGGVDEGPNYFTHTLGTVVPALAAWARARQQPLASILPERFRSSSYACAAYVRDGAGGLVPVGDAIIERVCSDCGSILAACYPDSLWPAIMTDEQRSQDPVDFMDEYRCQDLFGFICGPDQIPPAPAHIAPDFVLLPNTGMLSSRHETEGRSLRLWLCGCPANPSHSHPAQAQLLLDLDGIGALVDRGQLHYQDARCSELRRSYRHCILTPENADGSWPDQTMPKIAIIPYASRNADVLEADIDLTACWPDLMASCSRQVHCAGPDGLVLHDQATLLASGRVAVHFQTLYPVELRGTTAFLYLPQAVLEIHCPWADSLQVQEDSIDLMLRPVFRITARSSLGVHFNLSTELRRGKQIRPI